MFYHRVKPENPHWLQIMIALSRLASDEEEGEEILLSSSLFISHSSWTVRTAVWDEWMCG